MPRDARGDKGDLAAGRTAARVFAGELGRALRMDVNSTRPRHHSMCTVRAAADAAAPANDGDDDRGVPSPSVQAGSIRQTPHPARHPAGSRQVSEPGLTLCFGTNLSLTRQPHQRPMRHPS